MRYISQPVRKKDAMALVTGQPVYVDDLAPKDCLVVKVLRSPHAFAKIVSIRTDRAERVPGVVAVLTHKDAPEQRFTQAGQTWPEPSPYDRRILDEYVRFVGDGVALVAAETEQAAEKALKLIQVEYEVLEPVLDPRTAKDNPILVHPEDNWRSLSPVGADNRRNLCASGVEGEGDVEAVLASCDCVVEHTYHTKAVQQSMMETFRAYTELDPYGRLVCVAATQIPFHVRRILSNALGIPKSKVRVIKPRIGGGFGAKQTAVCEAYPALVTWKTGRPAKIVYTREESLIASSPRHEMEVTVRVGADKDGTIRAADMYALSNTGAYGEHGPTTVGLVGHKSLAMYGKMEAFRFSYDVVYTNVMSAGAYRGYGATQGFFAMESAVDELAHKLGRDPAELRLQNLVREGQVMPAYYGETLKSCHAEGCLRRVMELIGWREKQPGWKSADGRLHGVGLALAMQGSGISAVDVGSVRLTLGDDGTYTMNIGATDMGTGCDTILAQMAAEVLDCDLDSIAVHGVDTDVSPYDCGSYASSTTYVTGMAAVRAATQMRERIQARGAEALGVSADAVDFDGTSVYRVDGTEGSVTLAELGYGSQCGKNEPLSVEVMNSSPVSPPPFMAGAAEVEIDPDTGVVTLTDYAAVIDCGTVINANLARVQAEGGLAQGIGMALFEDVVYDEKGRNHTNSFLQYRMPTRKDVGTIRVEFDSSYEPTGPFGAKSIGEIVINTPGPAIANAVEHACGLRFRELPIQPEQIALELAKNKG